MHDDDLTLIKKADPGANETWLKGLAKYKKALGKEYETWYRETAELLEDAEPEEYDGIIDERLALLALALKKLGRQQLSQAFLYAAEGEVSPEGWTKLQKLMLDNEKYIDSSLMQTIRRVDTRVLLVGGLAAMLAGFAALQYRVEYYAHRYWQSLHEGAGEKIDRLGNPRVRRVLNELARHCPTCPGKAGEYESWDVMVSQVGLPGDSSDPCGPFCYCRIEYVNSDGKWQGF